MRTRLSGSLQQGSQYSDWLTGHIGGDYRHGTSCTGVARIASWAGGGATWTEDDPFLIAWAGASIFLQEHLTWTQDSSASAEEQGGRTRLSAVGSGREIATLYTVA